VSPRGLRNHPPPGQHSFDLARESPAVSRTFERGRTHVTTRTCVTGSPQAVAPAHSEAAMDVGTLSLEIGASLGDDDCLSLTVPMDSRTTDCRGATCSSATRSERRTSLPSRRGPLSGGARRRAGSPV
jgi:hypothetical protein